MSEATTIRVSEPHLAGVDEVRRLWGQIGRNGPEPSFSDAVRYLISIGIQFEKDRMLNAECCFTTDQALALHAHKMAQGREPTHEEVAA